MDDTERAPENAPPSTRPLPPSPPAPVELLLSELQIHPEYQRDLRQERVNEMVREYDPRLVGVLKVSEDGEGGPKYAWDGQHRLRMLQEIGFPTGWCQVSIDTPQEQALLFVAEQERRKKIDWFERHRANVFGETDRAIAIQSILDKHGLTTSQKPGGIRSVGTLYFLYDRGGSDLLDDTIYVIKTAWGTGYEGIWQNRVVRGTGVFVESYPDLDLDKIVQALKTLSPRGVEKEASEKAKSTSGSNNHGEFARVLLKVYNKQHGTKLQQKAISSRHKGKKGVASS